MGLGSFLLGSPGYQISNREMGDVRQNMRDAAGTQFSPGSSGYNMSQFNAGRYSPNVNPNTGRAFTKQVGFSDYVPGGYENAFTDMANSQMDSLKRGQAGGFRGMASQFGRSGLGMKNMNAPAASVGRGMADINRQTGMDKLNFGNQLYQFDRGMNLSEEQGLRGLGQQDYLTDLQGLGHNQQGLRGQFDMDYGADAHNFNKQLQTYEQMRANAKKPKKGNLGAILKGGAAVGSMMMGNPAPAMGMMSMPGLNAPGQFPSFNM